jgi:hypothetical protein
MVVERLEKRNRRTTSGTADKFDGIEFERVLLRGPKGERQEAWNSHREHREKQNFC